MNKGEKFLEKEGIKDILMDFDKEGELICCSHLIDKALNELSKSKQHVMSKKHRKNIMREVNRLIKTEVKDFDNLSQADKIRIQDGYIDKVCKEKGWTLNDFYFTDSKELDSLLGDV